jgi:MoaA/NifB/PqqE/SkfB family radical SAM enzyme
LFKKIVQEVANFPHSTLRIHGVGEPLLWAELVNALRFTSEQNVRSWLFTSLITQEQKILYELATSCTIIEISINSFDAENYKATKGIDAFAIVERNLKTMREIIRSNNLSTRMIASRVESVDQHYDAEFIMYWKSSNLLDDVFIRSYHDYNAILENTLRHSVQEITPCLVHWNRFNIDRDGAAVICFNELFKGTHPDETLVLGNVQNQSISELWHCTKLEQIRNAQLEKNYTRVDFTDVLPCKNCTSCQPIGQQVKPTSEHQINALEKDENYEKWKTTIS